MFAPESREQSDNTLRNPRRRQRTSLEDSVKPPNAKRHRSALRREAVQSSINRDLDVKKENGTKPDTSLKHFENENKPREERNLAIRSAVKTGKATTQTDHTVILSSNDFYTVTQLPSGSDQPGEAISGPARCVFNPESGFALLLGRSQASVWSYNTNSSSKNPGLFSISMPDWCTSDGEILMGTLVSNITYTVPGLFIVVPTTGKMVYWETASNAAFMGIAKQKQGGLQGSIPSLFFGERVTDVINAEPSGVVLIFSSGRVAQITFRDPQGKAAISVNFLQSTAKHAGGGLFHGIRNVLGGSSWRKDIAAVKAGNSLFRGQRDIIVASAFGIFEIWDSHWNSVNTLRAEIELQKDIYSFLRLNFDGKLENSVRILDFVPVHEGKRLSSNSEEQQVETTLFILAAISRSTSTKTFTVIKAQLLNDSIKLLSSHMLENTALTNDFEKQKPKLHIMDPWDTAFILMGQKVWILSLREIEASPSTQLLNGIAPKPFQDRVQFQEGDRYEILGSSSEEAVSETQNSGCILMVRGFGLIRISATSPGADSTEYACVTAKQKIEQAVFYGTMSNTPLSFNNDGDPKFTVEEFEEAVLEICDDILHSTAPSISRGGISLEQNLRLRSKALNDLITELLRRKIILSKRVRWELMWAGEKLAAQKSMWNLEENFRRRWDSETFLSRVISLMTDKFKTKYVPSDNNQNDHVRQWFIRDTFQMQHIIPWIFNAIRGLKGPSGRSGSGFLSQIYQASELSLIILEDAYQFREDHLLQYGLDDEDFDNGVLLGSYTEIPEFWTSESMVYNETLHMLDLELDSSRSWSQQAPSHEDRDMLGHIGGNSCRRLHVLNMMLNERVRWLSSQNNPKLTDEAVSVKDSSLKQRRWQLYKMAGIGQLQGAIKLAEEFRDVEALVELMVELQDEIKNNSNSAKMEVDKISSTVHDMSSFKQKIAGYFDHFGEPWADAFFSRQISAGQPGVLLSMKDYQPHITKFLRKIPSYAPLSWINDIVGEEDYEAASDALEKLALEHDNKLWDQRVQLSLAKLTRLADLENSDSSNDNATTIILQKLDDVLEISGIQDLTYDHMLPAFHSAIDQKAEVELALDQFGNKVHDRPALKDLLEDLLTCLISRQALQADQLINLLTLIDNVRFLEGEDSTVCGHEFYLAFRVLRLSGYASSDPIMYNFLHMLIWRRCIIRDDWNAIGSVEFRSDNEHKSLFGNTALARTLTDCITEEEFEKQDRGALYPIPKSSDIMNIGSVELVRSRFPTEQWPHIENDLRMEIATMKRFMEETKLEEWISELVLLAEESAMAINNDQKSERIVSESFRARFSWV